MKNFFRRIFYILTLRPHKAFSLPVTLEDIWNAQQVQIVVKPYQTIDQITKDIRHLVGGKDCLNVLMSCNDRQISESLNFPECIQERLEQYSPTDIWTAIRQSYSVHKSVYLLKVKESYSYKGIYVFQTDSSFGKTCNYLFTSALGDLYTKYKGSFDCENCSIPVSYLDEEGCCPECSYFLANGHPNTPILAPVADLSHLKQVIKKIVDIEKEFNCKVLNKDGHLFTIGAVKADE